MMILNVPTTSIKISGIGKVGVVRSIGGSAYGDGDVKYSNFGEFQPFFPNEIHNIKDPFALHLAQRMERLPVQVGFSETNIMSSCIRPANKSKTTSPVVLLHCFDSSCLEWRCAYPLLEEAGLETWAVDVLGWGFSSLEKRPSCNVKSKREHLYQLWKTYVKRPMVLVGPSLGASVAIDFAANYPEAVEKLILINPSVYAEGTGNLAKLPTPVAYAGVSLLKSFPLRLYGNLLSFRNVPFPTILEWTNIGRLHCLLPWWDDSTVNFMFSGGYNVIAQIKQVKHKTLIICAEHDHIISKKLVVQLHCELSNATMHIVSDCGHLAHVERPKPIAKLIEDFTLDGSC